MKKWMCVMAVAAMLAAGTSETKGAEPVWLESDSLTAIQQRLKADFPLTLEQAREMINKQYGRQFTVDDVRELGRRHIIEVRDIDGQERVHRRSIRNFGILAPEFIGENVPRGAHASARRISYVDSVLAYVDGKNPRGAAHRVRYRFSIDVPYDEAIAGDTLRAWMPVPMETQRQRDVRILKASPAGYALSRDINPQGVHNSIYFEAPAPEKGKSVHFEYEAEFVNRGEYFAPDSILAKMRPYDKKSALYKEYTSVQPPHIIDMKKLARQIVGKEKNPYRQSELVYDYIITHYPWAGAREYSTIECIPEYVVAEGHGDCGQVALLYISLMRSLGVPARWESGWMLHPGEVNLHDWAEVYFEGVGWVPVDASFGRYTGARDPRAQKFYSTGMDAHRLAANKGVGGAFYPAKKYVRSETVDAQMGEVETSRGNLFYPAWDQHLQVLDVKPVQAVDTLWALPRISVAMMRVKPGHESEMATQALMGMPIRLIEKDGEFWRAETPEGYISYIIDNSVVPMTPAQMKAWRNSERLVVTSTFQTNAYNSPTATGVRDVVTDLVNGDIVQGSLKEVADGRVKITLPDGRTAWVNAGAVTPIEEYAAQDFNADHILDMAYSMMGTPYFWGGTSTKQVDCSGLVKISYLSNGIILRRDASQQARTGKKIAAADWKTCERGDLLFFGNAKTGRVTHVAIYDENGGYVHSSGRVRHNSVDPTSPEYLTTPFLSVSRINGMIGTDGITYVRDHPWYFDQNK